MTFALLAALALPASAEPSRGPCVPWMGTARTWTTYDFETGRIRPMTLRDCGDYPRGALAYAQRCMREFGHRLASTKHVVIADFSTNANFVRLHVLQWNQEDPEASIAILRGGAVHGAGNEPDGITGVARVVKDEWDSQATPGGCMRLFGTGNEAAMQTVAQNLQAYRLDGLEERNACTHARGIFLHESYLDNDVDKVRTRRIEEIDRRDVRAGDFDRVRVNRHLGTAVTPGCITISNDDFDFIKASRIVPPPGRDWRPNSAPQQREGILFVSWFWGERDDQTIRSRYAARPRSCTARAPHLNSRAIETKDQFWRILREMEQWRAPR
ncbi:MAG: hypothetical protein HY078_10725 [Elusimicrobia bacterium]|nr:hypothetical protein [Elusimicrobiota bacterium]